MNVHFPKQELVFCAYFDEEYNFGNSDHTDSTI